MAYLPKNKYKKLYTKGDEYRIMTTGEPYVGEYLKLNDGRLFAGSDPSNIKGKLAPLAPTRNRNVQNNTRNNKVYSILQEKLSQEQDTYIPILSSKPPPTALDYSNGYCNRYISVRLNTGEYQEISKDVHKNFNKRKYNKVLNKVFFIKWDLGENSELINSKRLRQLEYDLPGIFNFFPDKGEYGIKNGVVYIGKAKIYPNGESISPNLPQSYQLGNPEANEIKNPNVPANENCVKCKFFNNGNCNKWGEKVRKEFYCRAFEKKGTKATDSSGY
jgi:hypothetical protein